MRCISNFFYKNSSEQQYGDRVEGGGWVEMEEGMEGINDDEKIK